MNFSDVKNFELIHIKQKINSLILKQTRLKWIVFRFYSLMSMPQVKNGSRHVKLDLALWSIINNLADFQENSVFCQKFCHFWFSPDIQWFEWRLTPWARWKRSQTGPRPRRPRNRTVETTKTRAHRTTREDAEVAVAEDQCEAEGDVVEAAEATATNLTTLTTVHSAETLQETTGVQEVRSRFQTKTFFTGYNFDTEFC